MLLRREIRIRLYFYIIGILFLSFGISASINSQLGASPMPSLQVGLQETIGLTVGSWEIIIGVILVLIMAMVRKNKPDILAFLSSFLTGLGIDMWLSISKAIFIPDGVLGKIVYLLLGLICIGLGVSMYLQSKFSPAPPDGMVLLFEEIWKMKRSISRTVFQLIILTLSLIFSGPIGIGTLVMVVLLGPIVGFLYPYVERYFTKINQQHTNESKNVEC